MHNKILCGFNDENFILSSLPLSLHLSNNAI